ncbi:MAG: relaxase/mobilization nuclease domain-containing protein [Oscillospiraceae bacterium]|nr:relaxase/mobilization nuclease domain-containing protein [Oscillospiraceae bacterium]
MPIIHFINSKTQTAGGMKNVIAYVTRTEKTESEDKQYVTALNCSAPTAHDEILATKNAYHKNSGRMYYHLVQSFPKGDDIPPELTHRIAVELAEKAFGKYECVVATHIDREHIHSHIVFNSVSFEDGKKYHSNGNTVQELMDLSDEICMKYGVAVLDRQQQKKKDVLSDIHQILVVDNFGSIFKGMISHLLEPLTVEGNDFLHFNLHRLVAVSLVIKWSVKCDFLHRHHLSFLFNV